jgi:hypothetical protein
MEARYLQRKLTTQPVSGDGTHFSSIIAHSNKTTPFKGMVSLFGLLDRNDPYLRSYKMATTDHNFKIKSPLCRIVTGKNVPNIESVKIRHC